MWVSRAATFITDTHFRDVVSAPQIRQQSLMGYNTCQLIILCFLHFIPLRPLSLNENVRQVVHSLFG